ncbi:Ig-like domain-containing protein [Thermococcus sp.]|uniref:Ig-like domain-containing protein n=1 Tax=Thermococcus sp. TaxID=35749 RepID=UPI0026380E9A|nr:Ig-like domain-containing protein [Thermococcus sp.]
MSNVSIPDGRWKVVDLKVPVVQYWKGTPSNDTAINFGNLNVSVLSIVPLRGAKVIIDGKSYNLTAENGGYYYYATGIDQKLKLPAGTYNYTVIVTYPNGKEVKLPQRTVIVRGPLVDIVSPKPSVYNTSMVSVKISINDTANVSVKNITVLLNGKVINVVYNSTSGLYEGALNLTNGNYHLVVTAVDKSDAFGTASVSFIVNTNAKVVRIPVNSETNVTVGVIGSANVTAENNTIVANVTTSNSTVEVQVPLVNNVPSVIINTTAINSVITGESNASLVAGWNASATASTKTTLVKTENSKKIYAVTIKANVSLGENGVAVVAFRNINISKVYVWKNGQKIQLTTNESNPLGYYYIQGNVVFVVLKEDPIVEVDGTYAVPITPTTSLSSLILMLNYMYYHYIQTQNATFHELYNKALEAGVNETILQQVMEYYNQSMEEYATAKDLVGGSIIKNLGDFRLFIHLRKSYADLKKAIRILQQVLEEQGS